MLREGNAIGAIAVARAGAGHGPSNGLVKTFAAQAVIAIEHVWLFKELEAAHPGPRRKPWSSNGNRRKMKVLKPLDRPISFSVRWTPSEERGEAVGARRGVIVRREGDSYHGVSFYNASAKLYLFHQAASHNAGATMSPPELH